MDNTNTLRSKVAEVVIKDGIIYLSSIDPNPTLVDYQEHWRLMKAKFGHLLPLPAVLTNPEKAQVMTKDVRDFTVSKEMAEITSAMAIMQNSILVRIAANLFFKVTKPSYPMQMFSDEAKAVEWLRSFVKK
jgi:predicted DNA binding CopG/RHH family protein